MTDLGITVVAGVSGGLAAALLRLVVRSGTPQFVEPDRVTGVRILQFGWWYRAATLFILAITIAIVVDIDSQFQGNDLVMGNIVVGLLVVVSGVQTIDAFTRTLTIFPEGLGTRSLLRKERFIHWSDVRRVMYSPWGSWFVIQDSAGKIRASKFLNGIGDLKSEIRQRLPLETRKGTGTQI